MASGYKLYEIPQVFGTLDSGFTFLFSFSLIILVKSGASLVHWATFFHLNLPLVGSKEIK